MNPAQLVSFTPSRQIFAPSGTGSSEIAFGIEYVIVDSTLNGLIVSDRYAAVEYLPSEHPGHDVKRLALLFPGGLGDSVALKACIESIERDSTLYPNLKSITIFSTMGDKDLFLDGAIRKYEIAVLPYPPLRRLLSQFDGVIGFGAIQRQSVNDELTDSFADVLQIPRPTVHATLRPKGRTKRVWENFFSSSNKRVAINTYSRAHYRSIPPVLSAKIAFGLSKENIDVYLMGSQGQRIPFSRNINGNKIQCMPPPGIYDVAGMCDELEEYIVFMDLMDGIICPDTFALHAAGCLEKPTVALFGLTSSLSRSRYFPTVKVIQGDADCSPCNIIASTPDCGYSHCKAMDSIEPTKVVEMIKEMI